MEEVPVVDSFDGWMQPAHESVDNIIYFSRNQVIMISVSTATILFNF